MAYGLSNGHVTDNVTWPWKVKLVIPIRLERNISKTAGDRDSKSKGPKDNRKWHIEYQNGHVTDDFTWRRIHFTSVILLSIFWRCWDDPAVDCWRCMPDAVTTAHPWPSKSRGLWLILVWRGGSSLLLQLLLLLKPLAQQQCSVLTTERVTRLRSASWRLHGGNMSSEDRRLRVDQ